MRIREAQKHTHPADSNTVCTARLEELVALFSIVVLYLDGFLGISSVADPVFFLSGIRDGKSRSSIRDERPR
jgi:hypothetical protein